MRVSGRQELTYDCHSVTIKTRSERCLKLPAEPRTCETEVQDGGRVVVAVPLSQATKVVVFVVPEGDQMPDLVSAAESTLGFWDNPLDDEDWNNA